jgi:hypothetical protein
MYPFMVMRKRFSIVKALWPGRWCTSLQVVVLVSMTASLRGSFFEEPNIQNNLLNVRYHVSREPNTSPLNSL